MKKAIFVSLFFIVATGQGNAQICPTGDLVIQNQMDLDDYVSTYPTCTMINGDIKVIGSSDVIDLDQLSEIATVTGSLIISENQVLENISGVSNIDLRESIIVHKNWVLQRIDGFQSIDSIGRITISQNQQLDSIQAFKNLQYIDSFEIIRHDLLQYYPSYNDLIYVGVLNLFENASVSSICGFDQLAEISTVCHINGVSLEKLVGFNNVRRSGSIFLASTGFQEIDVFNQVDTIVGALSIGGVTQVEEVNIFKEIVYVGASFRISFYEGGTLKGFTKLMRINDNPNQITLLSNNFENLNFLSNLKEIGGFRPQIQLRNNPNLTDISSLDGINPDSIGRLRISGNSSLSICHSKLICGILERDDVDEVDIEIEDNAPGCNSVEEILAQCALIDDEDDVDLTLCPVTSRPGMQINRISDGLYHVLYSYGAKQMTMPEVNSEAIAVMIEHFMVEKHLQFEFDRFELEQLCARAEKIVLGTPFVRPATPTNPIALARFEEVYSEVLFFQTLTALIDSGECVKL